MISKVFLISGKAGHGKSTFGDFLEKELQSHSARVLRIAFADYLKFVASKYYHWNGEKDEEGRQLLQTLGTDVVRKVDDTFWVSTVQRLMHVLGDQFDFVIIDDVRFVNEVEAFPMEDTIHIRIERFADRDGLKPYINPILSLEQLAHVSETNLDNYVPDIYVANRGSRGLEQMERSAKKIADDVCGG